MNDVMTCTRSNRAAWNEAAAHYADTRDERIEFLRGGRHELLRRRAMPYLQGLGRLVPPSHSICNARAGRTRFRSGTSAQKKWSA